MDEHDAETQAALEELRRRSGLSAESRLYRFTLPEFLQATDDPAVHRLSANEDPSEAVLDVYGQDHVVLAQHVGPGLAFSESLDSQWDEEGRVRVEVRLQDVLDQGGRPYPVESVITERVWYLTIPAGSVTVRSKS